MTPLWQSALMFLLASVMIAGVARSGGELTTFKIAVLLFAIIIVGIAVVILADELASRKAARIEALRTAMVSGEVERLRHLTRAFEAARYLRAEAQLLAIRAIGEPEDNTWMMPYLRYAEANDLECPPQHGVGNGTAEQTQRKVFADLMVEKHWAYKRGGQATRFWNDEALASAWKLARRGAITETEI